MSDADLRVHIRSAALDVYEAALAEESTSYDIHFAAGTLQRLTHELRLRGSAASEDDGMMPA